MADFQSFLHRLTRLTISHNRAGRRAPHKPVLLLALADWYEATTAPCSTSSSTIWRSGCSAETGSVW